MRKNKFHRAYRQNLVLTDTGFWFGRITILQFFFPGFALKKNIAKICSRSKPQCTRSIFCRKGGGGA